LIFLVTAGIAYWMFRSGQPDWLCYSVAGAGLVLAIIVHLNLHFREHEL
jgi:hypothetical protein